MKPGGCVFMHDCIPLQPRRWPTRRDRDFSNDHRPGPAMSGRYLPILRAPSGPTSGSPSLDTAPTGARHGQDSLDPASRVLGRVLRPAARDLRHDDDGRLRRRRVPPGLSRLSTRRPIPAAIRLEDRSAAARVEGSPGRCRDAVGGSHGRTDPAQEQPHGDRQDLAAARGRDQRPRLPHLPLGPRRRPQPAASTPTSSTWTAAGRWFSTR